MEKYTFDPLSIDFNDEKTWDLICSGKTKGVFQLESNLGKSWAKRVKPRNIEELAALISIIRPGTLKAIQDGKSMTQRFVDRKNLTEKIEYLHESLEPILKNTQGVLVYQEQSMQIAQQLAGFNLQEADNLRKAIGKKKADLMAEIKKDFLAGTKRQGIVDQETAEEIFSWIEKSSRYAFNKSHAVSYAICAYWSAYAKAHYPLEFYCNYLLHSSSKIDPQLEVKQLVSDARSVDIRINPPSVKSLRPNTSIIDGKIYFGLLDVKTVGKSQVEKLKDVVVDVEITLGKPLDEWNWYEFLVLASARVNKRMLVALVSVGYFDHLPESRSKMLDDLDTWNQVTKKQQEWAVENHKSFKSLLALLKAMAPTKKEGGATFNSKRSSLISDLIKQCESPSYSMKDDPQWIIRVEEQYLGVPLTYSKVEICNTDRANCTIKDVVNGKSGDIKVAVSITEVAKWKQKQGKNSGAEMAFLRVEDGTGSLDSVTVFAEKWEEYKGVLYEGNNVIVCGTSSKNNKKGHDDGIIVESVIQI